MKGEKGRKEKWIKIESEKWRMELGRGKGRKT